MVINSFILSQLKLNQDVFIFNTCTINRKLLLKDIFGLIEKYNISQNFLRVFEFEHKPTAIFYWKSDEFEPGTNRKGMYVIFGFIMDYLDEQLLLDYSRAFFEDIEKLFHITLEDEVSDQFFRCIQNSSQKNKENFNKLNRLTDTLDIKKHFKNKRKLQVEPGFFWKKKSEKYKNIYILENNIGFYDKWEIFIRESFELYKTGIFDISTLDVTKGIITFFIKQDLPFYAENVKLKTCRSLKYLEIDSLKKLESEFLENAKNSD